MQIDMVVQSIHATDPGHLERVKSEMLELGAPTIRVVDMGDYLQALEGSHRLAAAYELGIVPIIKTLEDDEVLDMDDFDLSDNTFIDSGTSYTASDLAQLLEPSGRSSAKAYDFRKDEFLYRVDEFQARKAA